eukprot:COSAG03_NODE_41_length_17232_cov_6.200315_8_plen_62_part_00
MTPRGVCGAPDLKADWGSAAAAMAACVVQVVCVDVGLGAGGRQGSAVARWAEGARVRQRRA